MSLPPEKPSPLTLEQLLQRGDIWRGQSQRFTPKTAMDTGYSALNSGLLAKGWPFSSLIEICQQNLSNSEWLLLTPALLKTSGGYIVLLNPPAMPFCQALIQVGMDLERLLIVQTTTKADFLASFFELVRADACDAVLAWQPKQALSYTELRKCLLATADGAGLYFLFRPASSQQQNSPAVLRLLTQLTATDLHITILKEKGSLQNQQQHPIAITLPRFWHGLLPHRLLEQPVLPDTASTPHVSTPNGTDRSKRKLIRGTQLRRGKS